MARVRIPPVSSLNIEEFSGSNITRASSWSYNAVFEDYPEGMWYATQRPSVNTIADAADGGADARGRGYFYWDAQSTALIANNDTIYVDNYAGTTLSISAGTQRVYFAELGDYVAVIDPENNEGWVIDSTPSIQAMTGTGTFSGDSYAFSNFPPNNGKTLRDGVAVLDGTLYVLADDNTTGNAEVWGSDLYDVLNWNALNFLTAEKEEDGGIFIGKHHDNIVVFGKRTIEFFYNAGNPTGSPLTPRFDISYNIGCTDGKSVWIEGDRMFFVGVNASSMISVYKLAGFKPQIVSDPPTDSFLTTAKLVDGAEILGAGFSSGGRTFYIPTLYHLSVDTTPVIAPDETLVYNDKTKTWSVWEHASSSIDKFPVIGWSVTTSTDLSGRGVFSNGDIFEIFDDFNPQDSKGANLYVEADYVEAGYISDTAPSGDVITMKVRVGHMDHDTRNRKRFRECRFIGDEMSSSQTLTVRWADENHDTFQSDRTLDISNANAKLTRLGMARSRTWEIEYSGTEQLRYQGLELDVEEATS